MEKKGIKSKKAVASTRKSRKAGKLGDLSVSTAQAKQIQGGARKPIRGSISEEND